MTERNPALWMQNRDDHNAEQERALLNLVFGEAASGVASSSSLRVTQSDTPGMTVKVAPGYAIVLGTEDAHQGSYGVWNDDAKTVTIGASDPTNARHDIIVARIKDSFYSGSDDTFTIEAIAGTPAGSPADPDIPANCLPLARVVVGANAASIVDADITDLRTTFQSVWGTSWGHITTARVGTTDQTGISSITNVTGLAVNFTPVPGRRYRVDVSCFVRQTAATGTAFLYLNGGGLSDKAIAGMRANGASTDHDRVLLTGFEYIDATDDTPITLQVRASTSGGTVQILHSFIDSKISVMDVGPS